MKALTLRPIRLADHADLAVVMRLWQLYRHDLSEFRDMIPDEEGTFTLGRLPAHLDDPHSHGYLFRRDSLDARPLGFAFVAAPPTAPRHMSAFFVVRGVRRQGVGQDAARQLFARHRGPWEVAFQEENPGAARFWRRLAAEVAVDDCREERRPVPGKPEIPPDTWLSFTT